jgi:hypothetical protein
MLLQGQAVYARSLSQATQQVAELAKGVILSSQVLRTARGPDLINQLDIDLTSPTVHLGVIEAYNRLISPDEVLSSMAKRSGAIAGVNGDYFEIHGPGRPIGMLEIDGQLLQSPVSYPVLGITTTGAVTIGTPSFSGSVNNGSASHPLTSVNIYGDATRDGLVLITPALGGAISVAGDTVALLQPQNGGYYTVQSVSSNTRSLPALSAQYALIGGGPAKTWLAANLHPGNQIHVSENVVSDAPLAQAIGGGPIIVRNGAIYHDPHPPASAEIGKLEPATTVGVTRDGRHVILVVFDGRGAGPTKSVGLTYADVASYMLAHGAYNAMLFDKPSQ